jgi:regulator of sirC expression with transglutaminase-like and TPR domain
VSAEPFSDRPGADAFLSGLAGRNEGPWPLGAAALALACRDRPRVDLARYHQHLAMLAREVSEAAAAAGSAAQRVATLSEVIAERHGYAGDTLTYEDAQNANLMRVIDRRKGLPVALGILYLHAGRAQGWTMAGLAFPGHFLLRLEAEGERLVLDPFHGGRLRNAAELRELLKAIAGNAAELEPQHYAAVDDREILLRLQNNLKLRFVESQQLVPALGVIEGMLLFAPDLPGLWREAGLIHAELGNLRAGIAALERCHELARDDAARRQAAALLQRLRTRLQ